MNERIKVKTNMTTNSSSNKINKRIIKKRKTKRNFNFLMFFTFVVGVLLIFYSYAWFYASLDVKIKFFNMVVTNNSGLSISFDGINFTQAIEISKKTLIDDLKKTYPKNTSQWASLGLRPISTNGILNSNQSKFNIFVNKSFTYKDRKMEQSLLNTMNITENQPDKDNYYVAFDLFLKNVTGSPVSDNLFLDNGTGVSVDTKVSEEMEGLLNSIRFGFVKIGSTSLESNANIIQNINCNNNCKMFIYEPNSNKHSKLSIERARYYNINLKNGEKFPTYASIKEGNNIDIRRGLPRGLDTEYFSLQKTQTDFKKSLFDIPDGITKIRVYVWIEGQDIDSLETRSDGTDISININFIKDTAGYDYYN